MTLNTKSSKAPPVHITTPCLKFNSIPLYCQPVSRCRPLESVRNDPQMTLMTKWFLPWITIFTFIFYGPSCSLQKQYAELLYVLCYERSLSFSLSTYILHKFKVYICIYALLTYMQYTYIKESNYMYCYGAAQVYVLQWLFMSYNGEYAFKLVQAASCDITF